jgi:hypothetical protein
MAHETGQVFRCVTGLQGAVDRSVLSESAGQEDGELAHDRVSAGTVQCVAEDIGLREEMFQEGIDGSPVGGLGGAEILGVGCAPTGQRLVEEGLEP